MHRRKLALHYHLILVLLTLGMTGPSKAQSGTPIDLMSGHVEIRRFNTYPETVLLGDPAIADVTVVAGNGIVLTGKVPGTTNLIVFDQEGAELINTRVKVGLQITIVEGGRQTGSYVCNPDCHAPLGKGLEQTLSELPAGSAVTVQGGQAGSR